MARARDNIRTMIREVEAGSDFVIRRTSDGQPLAVVIPCAKYLELNEAYARLQREGRV